LKKAFTKVHPFQPGTHQNSRLVLAHLLLVGALDK
jgi:hypothetical protein